MDAVILGSVNSLDWGHTIGTVTAFALNALPKAHRVVELQTHFFFKVTPTCTVAGMWDNCSFTNVTQQEVAPEKADESF